MPVVAGTSAGQASPGDRVHTVQRGESLWSVDVAGRGAHERTRHFEGRFGRIRMVKRAPGGSLWIGTSNGGGRDRIVRIRFT